MNLEAGENLKEKLFLLSKIIHVHHDLVLLNRNTGLNKYTVEGLVREAPSAGRQKNCPLTGMCKYRVCTNQSSNVFFSRRP